MGGAPRVVGRLAEHRPEFGGATLGDVPMPIAGPGLVGAGKEPRIAGGVLGTGKALRIAKGGDRGEHDRRPYPGNGLEPPDIVPYAPGPGPRVRGRRPGPVRRPAATRRSESAHTVVCPVRCRERPGGRPSSWCSAGSCACRPASPPAQEPPGGVDLGPLDSDEMLPPRQRGAQRAELGGGDGLLWRCECVLCGCSRRPLGRLGHGAGRWPSRFGSVTQSASRRAGFITR
jgi:hypothetical protein